MSTWICHSLIHIQSQLLNCLFFRNSIVWISVRVLEEWLRASGADYEFLRNYRFQPLNKKAKKMIRFFKLLYRLGNKHPFFEQGVMMIGGSMLSHVVYHGAFEHVLWLVNDVKVPLDVKNCIGMTALDIARYRGHKSIEKILIWKMDQSSSKPNPFLSKQRSSFFFGQSRVTQDLSRRRWTNRWSQAFGKWCFTTQCGMISLDA